MPYYDHYYSKSTEATKIGRRIKETQSEFLLKLIFRFIRRDSITVLEIGPGKGYFAGLCKEYDKIKYTAIEANEKQANALRHKGLMVDISIVPPIKKLDGTFDAVLISHFLEHMDNLKSACELLKEVNRILKSQGMIFIVSPDYLLFKEDFFNVDYTHNYVTTARRVKQLIEDYGFRLDYANYMSGPLRGSTLTFLSSWLIRLLYFFKLPYLVCWNEKLYERIYKIKISLMRSFLIVGRKNG